MKHFLEHFHWVALFLLAFAGCTCGGNGTTNDGGSDDALDQDSKPKLLSYRMIPLQDPKLRGAIANSFVLSEDERMVIGAEGSKLRFFELYSMRLLREIDFSDKKLLATGPLQVIGDDVYYLSDKGFAVVSLVDETKPPLVYLFKGYLTVDDQFEYADYLEGKEDSPAIFHRMGDKLLILRSSIKYKYQTPKDQNYVLMIAQYDFAKGELEKLQIPIDKIGVFSSSVSRVVDGKYLFGGVLISDGTKNGARLNFRINLETNQVEKWGYIGGPAYDPTTGMMISFGASSQGFFVSDTVELQQVANFPYPVPSIVSSAATLDPHLVMMIIMGGVTINPVYAADYQTGKLVAYANTADCAGPMRTSKDRKHVYLGGCENLFIINVPDL